MEEKSYHLGYGIDAVGRGAADSYYHRDEQLSTALITGGDGVVENYYQYDAFGILLENCERHGNRIGYTGQQYDGVAGQYYLRARYYRPDLGRFTSEDTFMGDGLNLYAYCQNNPVTYYDPSGYSGECPPLGKFADGNGDVYDFIPDQITDPNGTTISKEYNRMIYDANWSNHDDKHLKANTVENAYKYSHKNAQYRDCKINCVLS